MSSFVNHREDSAVSVDEASSKDNVTYYKISVKVGSVRWNVLHRYSDFVELHEKLVADHGVAKELLPPKKVIRNKTPKFVEQRREALSEYLKNIFNYLRLTMPSEFAHFLDFHLYDIFFLLQVLAKNLFLEGDKLLQFEKSHKFTPLELHAISERLKIACPSMEKTDQMYDFSHVLDFCSQVRSLNIEGSYEKLGTSNIVPNNLQFDLIPFKSLIDLKILGVPMACIQSVGGLRDTLVSLSVFTASVVSLNEFLLVDILHKDPSSIADTVKWKKLSLINFASNNIENVDWAIRLVPRLQHLSLTSNKLKELCDISCLHELRVLNLSMNSFSACDNWHAKIGNIVKIDLSQNKVESLRGFSRLYSLESLDLSCNVITDVEEVQHICRLPCLEYLWLTANPVASSIDYRVKVIEQFNARMSEICLDNEKASEKELDTARVLQALRVVKEGRGGAQWGRGGYNVNPRPELEAPRRRRGRARGGFPRQQQPQAEAPAAAAVEAPPVGVPQPKHLSKTSSPLTNDPLYMESFMNEMGTEMRAAPVANEVHPGHYGFASLAAEDYKSVAARSHVYAKTVSPSMHSYYVGMHVYARMLDLHRQTGSTLTVAESDFVTQMEVGNYAVTKLAEQYMAGFGNTTIPGSSECDFMFNKPALQAAENIVGFFGHIADNPIDYATYVCPGVLAQRIVEDVARTVAPVADDPGPNWQLEIDIPEEEADQEVVAPQPNIRCIGWAPRERLRQEMMNGLAHAQITPDAFHSDNASIPINTRLMNYVHYQLSEVRGYVEGVLPRTKNGSVAQLVTGVLNDNDEVSIRAPFPVAGSIAFFASAFRYRIDVTVNPQMLAPYEQAPVIANLERNRLSENPLLNEHLYHTIYIDSHARLKRIVKHNFAVKV